MTYWQGGIAILGGIAVLVALCIVVIRIEKRSPGTEYDERQKQVQGNAYRISFYVSFFYFLGLRFCMGFLDKIESVGTLLFIGVVMQVMVFHIYCLLAHAALPLKGKPWRAIWGYVGLSALNFMNFGMQVFLDGRYAEKSSGDPWNELILAMTFGALALMHLIQYLRDKRDSCE